MALVLVPFVVSAVALLVDVGGSFVTMADLGLTELRTRDVGRHAVLIGPYSRDGWNHPGPVIFYVLAVPYRLLGSRPIGLLLGALAVNAASVVGIAVVARRRGGLPLLLVTLLGMATLLHAYGPQFVSNPWNPYVVVLPFALLLFLTWEAASGQAWALPVAAGVATFCTQTHIGYAPLTLPFVAAGAVALAVPALARDADPERRRHLRRAVAWTAVVLVALWLPPVLQQVGDGQGNLTEVLRYFRAGGEGQTIVEGGRAVLSQFALVPEWVSGDRDVLFYSGEPAYLLSIPAPVLVVPFAAVVVLLARRRHGSGLRLAAVVAAAMTLGLVSVVRTTGPAYGYRLRWNSLVAMTALVLTVWGAWELLRPERRRRLSRAAGGVALVLLTVVTAASTVNAITAGPPYARGSSIAKALEEPLLRELPAGDGVVVVGVADTGGGFYQPAIVRYLERRGVPVRVAHGGDLYGEHRVLRPDERVRARLVLAADTFDEVRRRPDLELVSYWGTVDVRERARRVARLERLQAAADAGRITPVELLRGSARVRLGRAVGLFLERDP